MYCPLPRGEAMRRRSRVGGKPVKTRHRKSVKRRSAVLGALGQARGSGLETNASSFDLDNLVALSEQTRLARYATEHVGAFLQASYKTGSRYQRFQDWANFTFNLAHSARVR